MDPAHKICIIANPTAGHGKAQAILPQVEALLKECDVAFDLIVTQGPGHGVSLARELAASDYRAIVAMGGDGTLGEVVNGVLTAGNRRAIPIGAIPAGTGNDFITGNRLFSHWSEAIRALARPNLRQFDVMLVKDAAGRSRYAVNSVGVGFDAYVVKRVSELKSKKFGSISYALEVVRGLLAFNPNSMTITIDENERHVEKAWLCAVLNSENLGGGMKIIPGAISDDGNLHLGYLFDTPRLGLLGLLLSVFRGTHVGRQGVYIGKGLKAKIDAPAYYPCHIDGDLVEATYPLSVELAPGAVPFLVGG
ncbi:MAG: diacylglycerol/lipid kinase family protein [Bacillota bacterium]|nr:diacylglycerol kinase family lipid kinase [Candidatus Fermentithermobacillaceae bacterium]